MRILQINLSKIQVGLAFELAPLSAHATIVGQRLTHKSSPFRPRWVSGLGFGSGLFEVFRVGGSTRNASMTATAGGLGFRGAAEADMPCNRWFAGWGPAKPHQASLHDFDSETRKTNLEVEVEVEGLRFGDRTKTSCSTKKIKRERLKRQGIYKGETTQTQEELQRNKLTKTIDIKRRKESYWLGLERSYQDHVLNA